MTNFADDGRQPDRARKANFQSFCVTRRSNQILIQRKRPQEGGTHDQERLPTRAKLRTEIGVLVE